MIRTLTPAASLAVLITAVLLQHSAHAAEPPASTPPNASRWWSESRTSALDGKTTFTAGLKSTTTLANSVGVEEPARLLIRCTPGRGLETFVVWPMYMGAEGQMQAYRLHDQPIVKELWAVSKDGTSTFIQEDEKIFLTKLEAAKRLVVQASGYHQTPSEAVFELDGVNAVAAAALKACS